VVRERRINESDRLLNILTPDRGLITAFADGALRLKNKNSAATGLLCYSKFTLYHGKDTYKVNEASAVNVFFRLREDIVKLTLAQYFCELSKNLAPEEENADEYLRLTLNALHLLAEEKRSPLLIKAAVELRMLILAGYMPELGACRECGGHQDDFLFDFDGGILCRNCFAGQKNAVPLSKGVLAALRHIVSSGFERMFSFSLPQNTLEELCRVVERFLLVQTECAFKTLEFFKTL
jgi:DNA repair protein RecO (recombination protein O)